jgi:hypothetical protein
MRRLPLWAWAARDLTRRPFETALSAVALFALSLVIAMPLLVTQGIETTTLALLSKGPSMVLRRIDTGGWAPIGAGEAMLHARSVPGVLAATPRTWGVVNGPMGPVTIQGTDASLHDSSGWGFPIPGPGEAVVGPGFGHLSPGMTLVLDGAVQRVLTVRTSLGSEHALVLHDVVLTSLNDARTLLGLQDGMASDLAIRVFNDEEEAALAPDLARAFPYPVRIVTRSGYLAAARASLVAKKGGFLVLLVPALLAMALLGLVQSRRSGFNSAEAGLCKALGWTTTDLFTRRWFAAIMLAGPATALGLASSFFIVFVADSRWLSRILFEWTSEPPRLSLSTDGAFETLLIAGTLVMVPWLMGLLLPAMGTASADPLDLLQGGDEDHEG